MKTKELITHINNHTAETQNIFLQLFTEMNEKAIESMNKDEPETALEFLKKADEALTKINRDHQDSDSSASSQKMR